jgi:hypothetical protein
LEKLEFIGRKIVFSLISLHSIDARVLAIWELHYVTFNSESTFILFIWMISLVPSLNRAPASEFLANWEEWEMLTNLSFALILE